MDIINVNLPTNGSFKRRNSTDEIILHHAEASRASVEEVNRWHLERGWTGIGYHFYILQISARMARCTEAARNGRSARTRRGTIAARSAFASRAVT